MVNCFYDKIIKLILVLFSFILISLLFSPSRIDLDNNTFYFSNSITFNIPFSSPEIIYIKIYNALNKKILFNISII